MKNLIILFLISIFSFNLFSQNKGFTELDYKNIQKAVSDPYASTYYPKLMQRFLDSDETLTEDEFRLLYYGHLYQSNYDPYSPAMEHNALALYLKKDELSTSDCDAIINYANISMNDFPFNFHHLRMAIYAYHVKGNHKEADKKMKMLNGIINAILSSGDGKSLRSAFHVIYPPHEYEIVNFLGFNAEYQKLNNIWDVISLSKNSKNIPALYFNVEEMLNIYRERIEKINAARQVGE